MPRFDHAYTFGFSVVSDTEDASDVTADMLMTSALTRLGYTEWVQCQIELAAEDAETT